MTYSPQSNGGKATAKILREKAIFSYYENPNICLYCKQIIHINEGQKVHDVQVKKFCTRSCAAYYNNSKKPKANRQKIKSPKRYKKFDILSIKTKQCLFSESKNWQSARSSIQKHARFIYESYQKPKNCLICGYTAHYEICHIKSVASFPSESLIVQINAIDNLIALCPTHHWEFDNNVIASSVIEEAMTKL